MNLRLRYIRKIRALLKPSEKSAGLSCYLHNNGQSEDVVTQRPIILMQCVEDDFYYGLFGQIVSTVRNITPVYVDLFLLNSLRLGESKSFTNFARSVFMNRLLSYKWTKLYKQFSNRVGYSSTSLSPLYDMIDFLKSVVVKSRLKTKEDLACLKINGILVGDLVNDSYLRFKPAPTINLSDLYLIYILWQAHRDIRRATRYFRFTNPVLFITSYSTYIQHGIAVRVALNEGVRVHTIYSNYQEFSKRLSIDDWTHTKNTEDYAVNFESYLDQDQKLKEAETALCLRLAGVVDFATSYMKKSAYAQTMATVPNVQGCLVIFLHDFFDSPHVYRSMVFTDFWEWICFTIEHLQAQGIRFFLKPHPNQISASDEVIAALQNRYEGLLWIPVEVTNKQLVEAGMACAVTVYGTVAHEMAYLGVPTIACGDHPHVAFDFCKTAVTKEEYAELLSGYTKLSFDKNAMREQSLIFYYMHNMNSSSEESQLLELIRSYAKFCDDSDADSIKLIKTLEEISTNAVFIGYVSKTITSALDHPVEN